MRRACLLLLLLCLVALPGCVPESYLLVTPHNSQRGENSDVITVENYAAMRSNLVQQVDRHAEQVSMVTYSYAGDVEQDLQRALDYIQSSYPMGAYALEDATYEIVQVANMLVMGPIFVGKYALMTAGSRTLPTAMLMPIKIMPPYSPASPRAAQHNMPTAEHAIPAKQTRPAPQC